MLVRMSSVKQRADMLNESSTSCNAIQYNSLSRPLTASLAENYIRSNSDKSSANNIAEACIFILEELCDEKVNESQVNKVANLIGANIVPRLNPGKLSYFNKKLLSKKDSIYESSMGILENSVSIIEVCDRILSNDHKLSNRFNFDKIISSYKESGRDMSKAVMEMCSLIDTYNIPPAVKLNVSLENIMYSLYKNNTSISEEAIVSGIVDYFLCRENVITDIVYNRYKDILNENVCVSDTTRNNLSWFLKSNRKSFLDKVVALKESTNNDYIRAGIDVIPSIKNEHQAHIFIEKMIKLSEDQFTDKDEMIMTTILTGLPLFTPISKDFVDSEMEIIHDERDKGSSIQTDDTLLERAKKLESLYNSTKVNLSEMYTASNNNAIETFKLEQCKTADKFSKMLNSIYFLEEFEVLPKIPDVLNIYRQFGDNEFDRSISKEIKSFTTAFVTDCFNYTLNMELCSMLKEFYNTLDDEEKKTCIKECINTVENYAETNEYVIKHPIKGDIDFNEAAISMKFISEAVDTIDKIDVSSIIEFVKDSLSDIVTDQEALESVCDLIMSCESTINWNEFEDMMFEFARTTNAETSTNITCAINNAKLNKMDLPTVNKLAIELEALQVLEASSKAKYDYDGDDDYDDEDEEDDERFKKSEKDKKEDEEPPKYDKKKPFFNMYGFKLAMKAFYKKVKNLSTKEKNFWYNVDMHTARLYKSAETALTSDRREQIIKGQVLPSFSKCCKNIIAMAGVIGAGTIAAGGTAMLPAVAAVTIVGKLACSSYLNKKERMMLYDEISTELTVIEKELSIAESEGDMKKYRFLLNYQKKLLREQQRIRYRIHSDGRKVVSTKWH